MEASISERQEKPGEQLIASRTLKAKGFRRLKEKVTQWKDDAVVGMVGFHEDWNGDSPATYLKEGGKMLMTTLITPFLALGGAMNAAELLIRPNANRTWLTDSDLSWEEARLKLLSPIEVPLLGLVGIIAGLAKGSAKFVTKPLYKAARKEFDSWQKS
jgi:hypothetical protein